MHCPCLLRNNGGKYLVNRWYRSYKTIYKKGTSAGRRLHDISFSKKEEFCLCFRRTWWTTPTTPLCPDSEKPHSLKPLSIFVEYEEDGEEVFSHPYLYEIDRLQPSEEELASTPPSTLPPSIEEAELVIVETVEQLRIAVAELAQEKVIGLDVEHHSYRWLDCFCFQVFCLKPDF